MAYTSLGNALIYSLPHLEQIHTLPLPALGSSEYVLFLSAFRPLTVALISYSPPSTDDTGDLITHNAFPTPAGSSLRPLLSSEIHTLFSRRRKGPYTFPLVDLAHGRGTVPSQPQPVSLGPPSMMGSMMEYISSFTGASAGDQIDALREHFHLELSSQTH